MSYTLSRTVPQAYDQTVASVRESLAGQGFGILTEIDVRATLHDKLGVDVAPQVILGACRPPLAHAALEAEPSVGTMLPCNVVVRSLGPNTSAVEAFDPGAMVAMTDNEALRPIADEVRDRLNAALDAALDTALDAERAAHPGTA